MLRLPGLGKLLRNITICLVTVFCLAVCAHATEPEESDERHYAAVRQAPGDTIPIGFLEQGTVLTVVGQTESYYEIDCYDMTGFISKEMVSFGREGYFVRTTPEDEDAAAFSVWSLSDTVLLRSELSRIATAQLGVRYVSGGTTPRGFDCSGFSQYVYGQCGISLPRTCDDQAGTGIIIPKEALQCGDLVFFQGTNGMAPLASHVGIYLGEGKLIHAGSGGITIVDLESDYFARHYQCARRMVCIQAPEVNAFTTAVRKSRHISPLLQIRNRVSD